VAREEVGVERQPIYGSDGRRIGVIVPSPNCVLEEDVAALLPAGVSAHFARVGSEPSLSVALLEGMATEAERESRKLALCVPAAVGYGCTSGSFFRGAEFDRALAECVSAGAGGVPAITASMAAVSELRRLDISAIAFCTPYEADMHARGVAYFESQGFTIVGQAHLGIARQSEIQNLTERVIKDLVRQGDASEARAIFVSCTGLPVLPFLAQLSDELRKPVFSSNFTFTRALLRLAGLVDERGMEAP
jgi:maleate isomerase